MRRDFGHQPQWLSVNGYVVGRGDNSPHRDFSIAVQYDR